MADEKHHKGRLAEVKALAHFASWGCEVAPVLGDNTSCDLVILKDGKPFRVEVKSAQRPGRGRKSYAVTISSNTHRRADGSLPNKVVDTSKFDLLAIYLPDDDQVLVWMAGDIETTKTFSITEERRAVALESGDDLVEGPGLGTRRVEGLCLCRECDPSGVTSLNFPLHPTGYPNEDSAV